jgi:hypothetical protein
LIRINSSSANLLHKVAYSAEDGGQTVDIASFLISASGEILCFDARWFVASATIVAQKPRFSVNLIRPHLLPWRRFALMDYR